MLRWPPALWHRLRSLWTHSNTRIKVDIQILAVLLSIELWIWLFVVSPMSKISNLLSIFGFEDWVIFPTLHWSVTGQNGCKIKTNWNVDNCTKIKHIACANMHTPPHHTKSFPALRILLTVCLEHWPDWPFVSRLLDKCSWHINKMLSGFMARCPPPCPFHVPSCKNVDVFQCKYDIKSLKFHSPSAA